MYFSDEKMASLRQHISSHAAPPVAAAPDPRGRAASLRAAAAALKQRMDAKRDRVAASDPALASARSIAEQTLSRREQLKGLKNENRDLESQLQQALSLKFRKESNHKLVTDSVSSTTATTEELNKSLMDLRNQRDRCTAVISDGLKGVKFIFDKIDPQHPEKEFWFCIMFDNGSYNLVQCEPPIKEFEEMVKDLNLSGDLFKFVRVAREKFQSSSVNGDLPLSLVPRPDVSSVPFSPPMTTSVNSRSEDVPNKSNSRSMNKRLPAKRRDTVLSPDIVRRSPRLKASNCFILSGHINLLDYLLRLMIDIGWNHKQEKVTMLILLRSW
ncbi:hypothetical protein EJB05_34419 [Eragrostis curvula]|uniref:Kinetochore protein SPC25 n=1 Tax=Eragrostis curvula TaxID=38414 RepID=A0A5J9U3T1_9POAL|nr:hypothetical protein EJB05_34419 [Eragrostis curvula]